MIHTLTITHRIISPNVFDKIYNQLERVTGEKTQVIGKGLYRSYGLVERGMIITLSSKKIHSRYRYNYMQISITLNPIKLLNRNKLEVTELEQVEEVKKIFNEEVKKIHLELPRLDYWIVNRIDYAINIHTPYVEEYIKLFQRGDKPRGMKELYCSKSKKRKQLDGSFYLFNDSISINFYDKKNERLKSNFNKDNAEDLLRLEVQCKKTKTNSIKTKNGFDSSHLSHYLSQEISNQQIEYYYKKTIGEGDYYKLSEAIKMVQESKYTSSTKNKLIEVLKHVNKSRSIWKARDESQNNINCFNRYLKKIRSLGINPVTIPNRWGIYKIENILDIIKENGFNHPLL